MTARKGERTSRTNERDYPHLVEMPVPPNGFGRTLTAMIDWHLQRGIPSRSGRGHYEEGQHFVRWCFAHAETADAFKAEFRGERVTVRPPRGSFPLVV